MPSKARVSRADLSVRKSVGLRIIDDTQVSEGSVGWTPECTPYSDGILERYRDAGFAHVSLTIAAEWHSIDTTMRHLARVRRSISESSNFRIVTSADDIVAAHKDGALGVSFNFQGAGPFGNDPAMVETYVRLGVRLAILSYNARNALGDGCQEAGNGGLSALGHRFVAEMNRCGMVIDLSHAGRQTALDTIDASRDPVVFSHSNPAAVYPHVRNIGDDLIEACARKGGLVGVNSLSFMLSAGGKSKVDEFVRHIVHVVDIAGPEHVALGMDWNFYDLFMQRMFKDNPGMEKLGYPPPPWDSLGPDALPQIVDNLLARGWSDSQVRGLLGDNMLRIARKVWRPVRD